MGVALGNVEGNSILVGVVLVGELVRKWLEDRSVAPIRMWLGALALLVSVEWIQRTVDVALVAPSHD